MTGKCDIVIFVQMDLRCQTPRRHPLSIDAVGRVGAECVYGRGPSGATIDRGTDHLRHHMGQDRIDEACFILRKFSWTVTAVAI